MAQPPDRRLPGKSKTDLRRGQFRPGLPGAKKEPPRGGTATTNAEQSLLFNESPEAAK